MGKISPERATSRPFFQQRHLQNQGNMVARPCLRFPKGRKMGARKTAGVWVYENPYLEVCYEIDWDPSVIHGNRDGRMTPNFDIRV